VGVGVGGTGVGGGVTTIPQPQIGSVT
jgi:hypothetical protein